MNLKLKVKDINKILTKAKIIKMDAVKQYTFAETCLY